jgi:glycosyltransferase involved in cell wall biosynthesis
MRFSIITPAHIYNEETYKELLRCIESIHNQTFKGEFEHIIVNDGSTYPVEVPKYKYLKVINQENLQRYTAYNTGFKAAKGQIFCCLDHDDEYAPDYLKRVDRWYKKYPKYKIFNFGCQYWHLDGGVSYRDAFEPKEEEKGHEVFGGGKIVNGTFVFAKEVYDKIGGFPPYHVKDIDCTEINYGGKRDLWMTSPYDFSAWYQMKYPEIRQYFMVNFEAEPNKVIKELGNPYGNDYALFYQYTREFHSKPMKNEYLEIVHPTEP